MALLCRFFSPFLLCNYSCQSRNLVSDKRFYLSKLSTTTATTASVVRRSANYQPSLWSYEYIQSLTSKYGGEADMARCHTLEREVKTIIHKKSSMAENPFSILELIDDLQRLGISHHFVDEISNVLEMINYKFYKNQDKWNEMDLKLKSLGFRLLRQHGYHVPQEIFNGIKDDIGNIKASLYEDMVGMLNLYEASYLSFEDERILDEAKGITKKSLKENLVKNNIVDKNMLSLVSHALELPLHWRVPRMEAKWFIGVYERRSSKNPTLIKLAKLDFNIVQAIHQEDLKHSSRWWRSTCWENFSFARNRLMENFIWTIGVNYIPHFAGRKTLTMVNALITTIDDVYDVYGTLDELEQFTDVVSRWDINAIEELPDYMKICFIGFYNSINEIVYNTMTNKGLFILPYLKKVWEGLCKSYLVEAKWYNSKYTPTFKEYMNNSYISIGAPVILMHAYLLLSSNITDKALQCVERAENIVRHSSIILRLSNDLGTSLDEQGRGDVPKSIQCYMNESGTTETEARVHIKMLISKEWKKLNKEREIVDSLFPRAFMECATNLARMSQFMYDSGDGHGCPEVIESHVLSLLINPI